MFQTIFLFWKATDKYKFYQSQVVVFAIVRILTDKNFQEE